jgi:hypothetical protein
MAKNQLKKFCRLGKFIEQNEPDLFQVFDDLCIMFLLKPERGTDGITLLLPEEASYKKSIIDAAYSENPDEAIKILKSLILKGCFKEAADFKRNKPINRLDHEIAIDEVKGDVVKLANGLTLKKSKKFVPISSRENMAVFEISGKGQIPTDGEPVPANERPSRKSITGGNCGCGTSMNNLNKVLEELFKTKDQYSLASNCYMRKVQLQLALIKSANGNVMPAALVDYLGNDEFTDSHLLDIYCEKNNCQDCLDELTKWFSTPNCLEQIYTKTPADYLQAKAAACKELSGRSADDANNAVARTVNLGEIRSPAEIRNLVKRHYQNDFALGKDLYIVFSNIHKDLWRTVGNNDMFHNWVYMSLNIYYDVSRLVKCDFDIARDLSLWGNLLKSDVLKYKPQATFTEAPSGYAALSAMPSPIELKKYSLNKLQEGYRVSEKRGGFHCGRLAELLKA